MIVTPENLIYTIALFTVCILFLLIYISVLLSIKNKGDKVRARWLVKTDALITKTIFYEDEENPSSAFFMPINKKIKGLLKKSLFRQTLLDELVTVRKNFTGAVGDNIVSLYNQLKLEKDSLKKLKSSRWHIKAKAIQELALMNHEDSFQVLYELTNHKNEFIRIEAQTSMVTIHGFNGLSFLNNITYPISEWHQINLLMKLSTLLASDFIGIESWLKSKNDTVIIFALKLSASYHQFQLYDKIVECLKHPNPKVRLQCIKCLKEIYEDTTAFHLMNIYNNEPQNHQLAILSALREIASSESINFLQKQLNSEDNQIKLAATRALYNCGEEGIMAIEQHPNTAIYPLSEIIQQIKTEQSK